MARALVAVGSLGFLVLIGTKRGELDTVDDGQAAMKQPAPKGGRYRRSFAGSESKLGVGTDLAGGPDVDLDRELAEAKAGLVLVWYSPICGKCQNKGHRIWKTCHEFRDEGWRTFGIYSGSSVGFKSKYLPDAASHRHAYEAQRVPVPILDDGDRVLLGRFGVKKTPTVVVLVRERGVVYKGAPWSLFDGKRFLHECLRRVSRGEPVPNFHGDTGAWG